MTHARITHTGELDKFTQEFTEGFKAECPHLFEDEPEDADQEGNPPGDDAEADTDPVVPVSVSDAGVLSALSGVIGLGQEEEDLGDPEPEPEPARQPQAHFAWPDLRKSNLTKEEKMDL